MIAEQEKVKALLAAEKNQFAKNLCKTEEKRKLLQNERFQFTLKFTAELPQTLETVVAQLEEQFRAIVLDAAYLPSASGNKSQFKSSGSK